MEQAPFPFTWNGEAMVPPRAFARRADQTFVVGQTYTLVEVQDRSSASHRHYFAQVREAFANLPEAAAERFPTENHLRKYALIKAGFYDERSFTAASRAEALRLAAFLRPIDEFALVITTDKTVTEYRAKSQDSTSMDKATFQDSKDKVLAVLSEMIGVTPSTLQRQGEPA